GGKSWTRIDSGIDAAHFTRVVRADPAHRGLLYAGTERGVYASWDDGGHWQPLQGNLPIVPVTDLTIKGADLIAATQGRGFWIADLTAVRATPEKPVGRLAFLPPSPATRLAGGQGDGDDGPPPQGVGENPP